MKGEVLFSIVLPTYNRAHILPETIKSVLKQSYSNWELLIVDDGSTDNTESLIKNINDPRIIYIYQENSERSAARNNGIKNANGQYVCFLDSDDMFLENHLHVLYKEINSRNFPVELMFTDCWFLREEGKEVANYPDLVGEPMEYFLINSIIPARVCIHNDILKEFQFREDIVIVEDTVLWVSVANKYPVTHLKESTILYRLHDDNSVNIKNNCFLPRLNGIRKLFENKQIVNKIGKKIRKQVISNCYLGIAKHYEFKRKFFRMLRNIIASIFADSRSKQTKFKLYMIYRYLRRREDV